MVNKESDSLIVPKKLVGLRYNTGQLAKRVSIELREPYEYRLIAANMTKNLEIFIT